MSGFWSAQLLLAMALNLVVQTIQIGAYAARLAGVQSGRIATSISLFNLFVTASRLASLFLTPMLGALADSAAGAAPPHGSVPLDVLTAFDWKMRLIIFAGTVGTSLGTALLPTFIMLFMRGIRAFERRNSMIRAVLRLTDPAVFLSVIRTVRAPHPRTVRRYPWHGVPRKLLIANVLVTAVYATGVQAAYYASVLDLGARATATGLSGLINGVATIAFTLIVDPTSAYITDRAAKGEVPFEAVKAMVLWLAVTAILGSLCSQLILWPSAEIIAHAANLFHPTHSGVHP